MSDAPERIMAYGQNHPQWGVQFNCQPMPMQPMPAFPMTEYIRADVAQAMLAKAREEREMFAWAMEAVTKAREDALREALQRIADIKRGHSEDVDEGHEQAYRAIEAMIPTAEDTSHD